MIHKLQTILPAHPSPRNYVPYYFTALAWDRTYADPLGSISLSDIKAKPFENQGVVAPRAECKAMGLPKIKRMVAGESRRRVAKVQVEFNGTEIAPNCGLGRKASMLCGEYGHNRKSCENVN